MRLEGSLHSEGNYYNKYQSKNWMIKYIMKNFLNYFDRCLVISGVTQRHGGGNFRSRLWRRLYVRTYI